MPERDADVISSRRDPDRPRRWPRPAGRWPWPAAILLVVVIAAGLAVGLAGRHPSGRPTTRTYAIRASAAHPFVVPPPTAHLANLPDTLAGHPAAAGVPGGTVLLLAGSGLQVLSAAGQTTVTPAWAQALLTRPGPSPPGPDPAVQFLQPVPGGFVALLGDNANSGYPDLGTVFYIPVTARGVAGPRFIARASDLAVAPGGRAIWVHQAGPRGDGATWLTDLAGRRLSPVLRLGRQILLAATVRGLLTGSATSGVRIIAPGAGPGPGGGPARPLVPAGALIAAVSPGQVAWQAPGCRDLACPLQVTDLRTGTTTVIALPPGTETDGQPGAFDPAGRRIALALDSVHDHLPVATSVYLADIATRRMTPVPGAMLPLTSAASSRGAIAAGTVMAGNAVTSTVTAGMADAVSWAGSQLWVLACDQAGFQAAYWPGAGPLRLLPAQPGQVSLFAVGTGPVSG